MRRNSKIKVRFVLPSFKRANDENNLLENDSVYTSAEVIQGFEGTY